MRHQFFNHRRANKILGEIIQIWIVSFFCVFTLTSVAGQFVDITAEIEVNDFNYWFLTDRIHPQPHEGNIQSSVFRPVRTIRCVVGTNTWMIHGEYGNQIINHWFTGTNIVDDQLQTNTPDMLIEHVGYSQRFEWAEKTLDGNPGRPRGVSDLLGFDRDAKIGWLAFCSGSALKREGRKIYPPSDMWKEHIIQDWSDESSVFKDGLGLPESINLITTTNRQTIFEYQVHNSTNIMGWNFPLEFYGVQYLPSRTNGWHTYLTIRGRVTRIGVGVEPIIPEEVIKGLKK